ncbi:hypothetical protein VTK56DRAFT_4326 [Thermocarpiscus australiensis]
MPLAVVVASPSAEVVLGSRMIVLGRNGSEVVIVLIGRMLVTPVSLVLTGPSLLVVVGGNGVVVGVLVVDGTIGIEVLLVGTGNVPFSEVVVEEITGGFEGAVVVVVVSLPDPEPDVVVVGSGESVEVVFAAGGRVVGSEIEVFVFKIGGRIMSPDAEELTGGGVVSDVGGSVTDVDDTPVPGPVTIGSTNVDEVFWDGSNMLVTTELILLRREPIGWPGSEEVVGLGGSEELVELPVPKELTLAVAEEPVGLEAPKEAVGVGGFEELTGSLGPVVFFELVVTMPVGARRISELVVEEGKSPSSSDEDEVADTTELDDSLDAVVAGSSRVLLALPLGGCRSGANNEDRVELWVEISGADELTPGKLPAENVPLELLPDEMSVEEPLADEISLEVLPDELSLDAPSVGVAVGVINGGVTTIVLEMMTVVTLGSPNDSESEIVCFVSDDELGVRDSPSVIVALVNCRLTWRGK